MTKPAMRAQARELRKQGRTYDEIVAALGVSKSSVSLWVRDLPKPPTPPERLQRMNEARWAPYRAERDRQRRETKAAARAEVGPLSDRELLLLGVGLYWAEGAKSKPYKVRESIQFINSDPGMIRAFLAWLTMLDVSPERLAFRVMIHETADVEAVERYWAALVGIDVEQLGKTTLKKHNPKTVRKNIGDDYRGCLALRVRQSAELYRRIEGWWAGIATATETPSGKV